MTPEECGLVGETIVREFLRAEFPSSQVTYTGRQKHAGDFTLRFPMSPWCVLIESKCYRSPVNRAQVLKLVDDVARTPGAAFGVMISLRSRVQAGESYPDVVCIECTDGDGNIPADAADRIRAAFAQRVVGQDLLAKFARVAEEAGFDAIDEDQTLGLCAFFRHALAA